MMALKRNGIIFSAAILVLCSCSSGGSGTPADSEQSDLDSESTWMIDAFTFTGGANNTAQTISGGSLTNIGITIVTTEGLDNTNGAYSGSSVNLQYTRNGTGTYTVVDSVTTLVESNDANPSLNVVFFSMQAGITTVNPIASTIWESTIGTIDVVVDDNDRYHFSTAEALPMIRGFDEGAGIEGAPDNVNVTMQNVFAR